MSPRVVLITGAAAGIGKATALKFAQHGAKVVLVDIDAAGMDEAVADITGSGGEAIAVNADVRSFDEQQTAFQTAISKFGYVDIVLANAGVAQGNHFAAPNVVDGKVTKPDLQTLEINLFGTAYTVHLAQYYLMIGHTPGSGKVKAIIAMSSMAAWHAIPGTALYTTAKLGQLGLIRGLYQLLAKAGIRAAIVTPFFADTALLAPQLRALLTAIPLTPLSRIAGAVLSAAADPDFSTAGAGYFLLDDGPVQRLPQENINAGVYQELSNRLNRVYGFPAPAPAPPTA